MAPSTIEDVCIHARYGQSAKIRKAIKQGIDINTLNIFGESPLACALLHKQMICVEFLLANGADPNLRLAGGYTAVHIACRLGKLSVLKLLIQKQGDLFLRDDAGLTPISYWAYSQYSINRRQKTLAYIDYLYPSALNELYIDRPLVKQIRTPVVKTDVYDRPSIDVTRRFDVPTSPKSARSPPLTNVSSDLTCIYPCDISDLTPVQGSIHYRVSQYCHVRVMLLNYQKVTCKCIDEQLRRVTRYSSSYNDLLRNELENIRRVQNFDNIIKCVSVLYNERIPSIIDYLIFEPIYRESLYCVLHKQHKYPKVRTISEILHAILSAVQYLHDERILHLNITSHAVYFTRYKQVKLGNFEYAVTWISNPLNQELRDIHDALAPNFYYEWLAPELFGNTYDNIRPTNKCDIYSIGVLLWELVQRKLPFKGYSKEQLCDFYRNEYQEGDPSLTLPTNKYAVPAVFYKFLQSTLCLSPSKRSDIDDLVKLCNDWPLAMRYKSVSLDPLQKRSTSNSARVTSVIPTQSSQSVLNLLRDPHRSLNPLQHVVTNQQQQINFDTLCESQKRLILGDNEDEDENVIEDDVEVYVKSYGRPVAKTTPYSRYLTNYKLDSPQAFPDTAVDQKRLIEEGNENSYSSSSSADDDGELETDDYIDHHPYRLSSTHSLPYDDNFGNKHNQDDVEAFGPYRRDFGNDALNACVPHSLASYNQQSIYRSSTPKRKT
ncbi:unnamed protein product [Didymodactylos carnosus]|uniref:Protein kinase domain-containing protein n=1 Tax=Didymodactylos carnosus TaxID=1234261 RepID=A0A8S2MCH2_9BILA|nr:unnamed protein product [Didymodactylos carnosus]CAF3948238.1 unnamed protein product [Didymodactylos carnosus]